VQPLGAIYILAAVLWMSGVASAGDYTAVEVGSTGLTLKNSAYSQNKHLVGAGMALDGRIVALMDDVDCLLAKLHALPPELADSPVAQQPVNDELKHLIDLALANNPELKPFRSELAVLAARTRQAGARQDPMLSMMVMDFDLPHIPPNDPTMPRAEFDLSQMYEGYGKRKLKRSIARLDETMIEQELAAKEQDIARQVTALYFEMAGTQAQLKVISDNIKLSDLLLEFAQGKYALNDPMTPQAMVFDAQLMRSMLEEKRITLARMLDVQRVQLTGLLGRPESFDAAQLTLTLDYPLPRVPEWDEAQLLADTLAIYPEFKRMGTMQLQGQLMVEMARRDFLPDYTVTARYDLNPGLKSMIGAGIMFPLFTNKADRQDAKLQENYAMLQNTGDQKLAMENMLATMIGGMKVQLTQMTEMIELYRKGIVPQARMVLDSGLAAYAANMLDLSELIRSQQKLLDSQLELEQDYIKYLGMLAELQVSTAGAFDPRSYLAPSLGPQSSAVQQELPEVPAPPRVEQPLDAPTDDQQSVGPFVEQLGLPQESGTAMDSFRLPPADGAGALDVPANDSAPGLDAARQVAMTARKLPAKLAPAVAAVPVPEAVAESAVPESEAQPDSQSEFYQPFSPARKAE